MRRGVDRHAAAGVARAYHQVEAARGLQQGRDIRGVVGQVGVHRDGKIGAPLQRVPEPGYMRGPQPQLARPVDDAQPGLGRGEPVQQRARTVRGIVVHHHRLYGHGEGQHLLYKGAYVLFFVVGRYYYENFHRGPVLRALTLATRTFYKKSAGRSEKRAESAL